MEAINRFKEFFQEFTDENGERIYMKKIQLMISEGHRSLTVNFKNILHFDPELGRQLRETNSARTIRAAERALTDLVHLEDPEYSDKLHVRPYNIYGEQKHTLRSLRAEHLGTLVSIDAIVTGATQVKPLLTLGMFKCRNCDTNMRRMQIDGKYNPPYLCENPECGRKGPFQLIQEHSEFIDWQKLIIQEKPEDLLPGQLPVSFTSILQDDIVDTVRPGDRVAIVGILQSRPESQLKTGATATYFKYIDILYTERETGEFEKIQITEEDVEKIMELSKDPFIANKIVQSIAPSIWGNDSVKEAIALLLFGGTPKEGIEGMRLRSESNVFLIGDPGTAKSQLLKYVSTIAPRGLFTSGRGSSAAGLCISRDSQILLSDRIQAIGQLVEENFASGEAQKHDENMEFQINTSPENSVFHSRDLQIESQPISRYWRIKSPRELIKITSKTGKKLTLTPETSILSIDEIHGLIWKPARLLKPDDRLATAKSLPISGKKEPPSMFELIADYPGRLSLLNVENAVNKLINKIREKKKLSIRSIAQKLGVSEASIYRWRCQDKIGIISLNHFIQLCNLLGESAEKYLSKKIYLQAKNGQTVILPRYMNENWFYILGLLAGDGRISIDTRETGYGGIAIGLSNRETILMNSFEDLFTSIGFKVTKSEGTEERPAEYRIWSKLIYHIFSKFGLSPSPKSKDISPNTEILFYQKKYLQSYLRGLFDADGWIHVRKERSRGSSHVGFASTSKKLIDFIQYGLARFGIMPYIRIKEPKTTINMFGKQINSKNQIYELTFSNYSDILRFSEKIGFKHPAKCNKLLKYCMVRKEKHNNDDNIPVLTTIRDLLKFYNYTNKELAGYKNAFSPSTPIKSISRDRLKKIIEKLIPDRSRCRIKIPFEIRNKFYREIKKSIADDQILTITGLQEMQIYDYFIRRDRNPSIPIIVFERLLESKISVNEGIKRFLLNIIDENLNYHEIYLKKYEMLKSLSNSDIFWDKVKSVEAIQSEDPYVYDLTIPRTHNFLVNGFVVHNTAAVMRDSESGEMALEAGALVLADRGIACIDEFDKMRPDDRDAIHEAMEQHTVSIAKAGIVATLNSRTSILAAANPKYGRWDPMKDPRTQLNMPPTVLSRFDLIFVMADEPNPEADEKLSSHILGLHRDAVLDKEPPIPRDLLTKYIAYARQACKPVLSDEALEIIKQFYLSLRSKSVSTTGGTEGRRRMVNPIAITARQLESLVRLAEARAKMSLSNTVTARDASAAVKLMEVTMKQIAMDEETGTFDADRWIGGVSTKTRSRTEMIDDLIDLVEKNLPEDQKGRGVAIDDIIRVGKDQDIEEDTINAAIEQLLRDGLLFKPREGYVKRI
ncbi:MAG: LAGLIDADG family homing endonuclease [Promethearchaeota archaeon]